MSQYLDEAAELLRKAAKTNELHYGSETYDRPSLNKGRERIAKGLAQLAAIDRGLIPTEMVGELLAQAVRTEGR